jgi:hypothetical protein
MCDVKRLRGTFSIIVAAIFLAVFPARAQTGSIQFSVQITPSTGLAEPVRGLPFYLLRKSYAEIAREASASVPKPDMDHYIDGLKLSPELKAWMKKHHSVTITGEDFVKGLTPDDILTVPEFRKAYLDQNAGDTAFGFPKPKYNEKEKKQNPEKYQRELSSFEEKVRKYLAANPQSKDGMDADLETKDPSNQWMVLVAARPPEVRRLTLDLAQAKYTVAQVQSDMNGRGEFNGLPPGEFWISTLGIDALVGDTREAWDTAVTVREGQSTQIVLSNFNATPPNKPAP